MLKKIKENKKIIVLLILVIVILLFAFLNKQKLDSKVKIKHTEASKITLEEYKNDVFSMKKPKNWVIESAGTGMYYAIRVYDPNETTNQIFLMLKVQPLLKSAAAKSFWQDYSRLNGNSSQYKVFANAVVLEQPTTENFYTSFNDIADYLTSIEPTLSNMKFPTFSNFKKVEEFASVASMKNYALDSKVLRGTFTSEKGKEGEGLFLASIVNFGNQYQNGVDFLYYMAYDIMSITAINNEFINYKDILLESINSIEFSNSYVKQTIDDGNSQTKQALALNASVQKSFDSYMNAWESRNKSYDIMSQKQSDATLGYERVYDTETNEVYKAYNGFTDDYKGERYKSISDEMYTEKVYGYIEK